MPGQSNRAAPTVDYGSRDFDRPPVVLDIDPFVGQAVLREVAAERPEADGRDAGLHDRIADVAGGMQRIDVRRLAGDGDDRTGRPGDRAGCRSALRRPRRPTPSRAARPRRPRPPLPAAPRRRSSPGRSVSAPSMMPCAAMRVCAPARPTSRWEIRRLAERSSSGCRSVSRAPRDEGAQPLMDRHQEIGRIGRLMGEGEMADLIGRRRRALHGDAEVELAEAEGLDLAQPDARLGGMEIDRGVGAQPAMQQRRHAARMALAGRAGEDDVARRRAAARQRRRAGLRS